MKRWKGQCRGSLREVGKRGRGRGRGRCRRRGREVLNVWSLRLHDGGEGMIHVHSLDRAVGRAKQGLIARGNGEVGRDPAQYSGFMGERGW